MAVSGTQSLVEPCSIILRKISDRPTDGDCHPEVSSLADSHLTRLYRTQFGFEEHQERANRTLTDSGCQINFDAFIASGRADGEMCPEKSEVERFASLICHSIAFAENVVIVFKGRDNNLLQPAAYEAISKLNHWLARNDLILNKKLDKTHELFEKPCLLGRSHRSHPTCTRLNCSCMKLKVVEEYKYLGHYIRCTRRSEV